MTKSELIALREQRCREKVLQKIYRETSEAAQDYMEARGILTSESGKAFDPSNETGSFVFAGAINYAVSVFGNSLVCGGGSFRKEDKLEIIECLKRVNEILNK